MSLSSFGQVIRSVLTRAGENFDQILSKTEQTLGLFYSSWCGPCNKNQQQCEKDVKRDKFEKLRFSLRKIPKPRYCNGRQYQYDACLAKQKDQIDDFIKNSQETASPLSLEKRWPGEKTTVRNFDHSNIESVLRQVKLAVVTFYAPWYGHCKNAKLEFVKAADKIAYEVLMVFGAVDCTAYRTHFTDHEVEGYPTIKYFSYFDKTYKDSPYFGGRKDANLVSFIHSQIDHPTRAKATTPAEAGFGSNVQLAFDSDFETIISQPTPTFVIFFASFCSHCSTAKPTFSKLATTLKSDRKYKVRAVAVDAAENPKVADLASIELLPTFKIYANGKQIGVYEGDRSFEDMLAFCESFEKKVPSYRNRHCYNTDLFKNLV